LVQPGDNVEAGQVVVILEAMKMENELSVLSKGTVKQGPWIRAIRCKGDNFW
jgi:biotin carboxyl carrier protein